MDLNNNGPLFISAHLQWEHEFSKDTPIPKINPSYAEHKKEVYRGQLIVTIEFYRLLLAYFLFFNHHGKYVIDII